MLKKKIRFEDLEGNMREEEFYFHFSQAELAKLQLRYEARGGMEAYFKQIMKDKDVDALMEAFDYIITGSIGEKGLDGKRFEKKNGAIAAAFKETDAYSVLFMELVSGGGQAFQEFLQGCLPNGLQERLAANESANTRATTATATALETPVPAFVEVQPQPASRDGVPPFIRENRPPTKEELLAMTPEQINQAFKGQ